VKNGPSLSLLRLSFFLFLSLFLVPSLLLPAQFSYQTLTLSPENREHILATAPCGSWSFALPVRFPSDILEASPSPTLLCVL
jgi:hypothetical protein